MQADVGGVGTPELTWPRLHPPPGRLFPACAGRPGVLVQRRSRAGSTRAGPGPVAFGV